MYQIDYNEIEEEVFKSVNECRNNPFSYIIKLREITNFFKNKFYHHPLEDLIETHEGIEGVEDAMSYLKTLKPAYPLEYSEEISQACRDHISDIGPKGLTTHLGSDGSNFTDRLEKYCEWDGIVVECLDFGFKIGDNVVMNLIIDDGVKEKYQRKNLFNNEFKYIGVGAGIHKIYGIGIVIGFAKNIRKIGSKPEDVSEWINKYYGESKKDEDFHSEGSVVYNPHHSSSNINNNKAIIINEYRFIEPDAPESSVSMTVTKNKKIINNKEKNYTKRTFLLKSGINYIVETEELD